MNIPSLTLDSLPPENVLSFSEKANYYDRCVGDFINPITGERPPHLVGKDFDEIVDRTVCSIEYTIVFEIVGQIEVGNRVLLNGFQDTPYASLNNQILLVHQSSQIQRHGLVYSTITASVTIPCLNV